MKHKFGLLLSWLFLFSVACGIDQPAEKQHQTINIDTTAYKLQLPAGFPMPDIPDDNKLTQARVALGKRLFYDPLLSLDHSISCASCHVLSKAFATNQTISPGVQGANGFRNSPTLANVAYSSLLNKDGGVTKLGLQALVPIEDHDEMNISIRKVSHRLRADSTYVKMAQRAYGRLPDPFVISRALAAFERTFISGNTPYDQYHFEGNKEALTLKERQGMKLFFGKRLQCGSCHNGFNLTDNSFQNNGLYAEYEDSGRQRVTGIYSDQGKFRVPTLRNIALTYPYMHDGSLTTLDDVLSHYASGGAGHFNQSKNVRGFQLSPSERQAVLAFLHSLTDSTFIQNDAFL